jgi:hypothetical protein
MLPTLVIEKDDGTIRDTIDADSAAWTAARRKFDRGTVVVPQDDWHAIERDVATRTDRFIFERPDGSRLFAGRFDDDARVDEASARIRVVSFGIDAKNAEPTGVNRTFLNTADDTVIQDAIDNVSTLSAGSLANLESTLSYSFANATRAKQIKKVAVATGGVVRYNDDRTVDYADRFGSDRASSLTLGPDQSNLARDISVQQDSRDPITHIRAYGGSVGGSQLTAEATTNSFSGGAEVWRVFEDTDIKEQDRLNNITSRLASQVDTEPRQLQIEGTVVGEAINRGDTVQVAIPDRGIDRAMLVQRVTERHDDRGRAFDIQLVNRYGDDDLSGSPAELRQRAERGFRGFVDRDNFRAIERQPVTASTNAKGNYDYPTNVVNEVAAEVIVKGLAYRGYTAGGDNQSTSTTGISGTASLSSDTTLSPRDETQITLTVDNNFKGDHLHTRFDINTDGNEHPLDVDIFTVGEGDVEWGGFTSNLGDFALSLDYTEVDAGDDIDLTIRNPDRASTDIVIEDSTQITTYEPLHEHPVKPGATEFGTETPSSVDLLINGNTVGSDIGSGTFRAVVDASGQFSAGDNTLALTSDTTGFVTAIVRTELFRRGQKTN